MFGQNSGKYIFRYSKIADHPGIEIPKMPVVMFFDGHELSMSV
jgi:hypothetical protein